MEPTDPPEPADPPATDPPEPTAPNEPADPTNHEHLGMLARRSVHVELLVTLVGVFVVQSFVAPTGFVQRAILNLLLLGVVVGGIRTLSGSRRRLIVTAILAALALLVSFVAEAAPTSLMNSIVCILEIAVFGILLLALCESVFLADGPVDGNRIVGAISIYFILGLIWAFAYTLLETQQRGSFEIAAIDSEVGVRHAMIVEFTYFSFVTLTTLGYGDMIPISRPAQILAVLEAAFGQLYLTVVVARLVGLQIARKSRSDLK